MTRRLLLLDRIRAVAVHRADQCALFDDEGSVTYRELISAIEAVAAGLRAAGVAPGDRIATLMEPSLAYAVLVLGALDAGVVTAVVNTRLTPSELRPYLEPIDPVVFVADPPHRDLAASLGRPVIELAAASSIGTVVDRLDPLAGGPAVRHEVSESDDAIIFPTGGTTGSPKGACYDHRGVWLWCDSCIQSEPDRLTGIELFCAPFFHVTFGVGILARLFAGDTIQILHRFDLGRVLQAIGDGAHRIIGATTIYRSLRDHEAFATTARGHLRRVQFGASPATPQFIQTMLGDYPAARVRSAYGATEFGPVTAMDHEELVAGRVEGVGRPLPGAVIRICDEAGKELPAGEIGEIRVRSPWATRGYYGLPEATAATYLPDGIRSGDMGYLGPDGWLYLSGRQKEMIISGGENVFPNEVEAVLREHPSVRDLIVYGMPDAHWGERVEAGIVPHPGQPVDLEQLRGFARRSLAGYKLPKTLRLMASIPLTPAYKPDRRTAQAQAHADLPGPDS
jgi:fatty-acyl-CoA synthase